MLNYINVKLSQLMIHFVLLRYNPYDNLANYFIYQNRTLNRVN
jgi:hypothetical protein